MKPVVPQHLLNQAEDWTELHRWERQELGKALRRLGLTYSEIREIVPVAKSTLSKWCQGIALSQTQINGIKKRVPSQKGIPKDSQWRRRLQIEAIRREATQFALRHLDDPVFVAGVVLYWAEGSKTRNDLMVANTDPRMLRQFIAWCRRYLDGEAEFVLSLHLHEGNDESSAIRYWRSTTGLQESRFTKTFIKPRGTGHRKNHLAHGVCRVRIARPADHWNRVMAWIDTVGDCLGSDIATLAPGR